jgi:chromate transporter
MPAVDTGLRPGSGTSAWGVFLAFLKLGLTSFGGPVAHLGYFRVEFVQRRRWLEEAAYADLVALCQFLPGPASRQVGIGIGIGQAGLSGGLAAWAGFTLPSALLMRSPLATEFPGWGTRARLAGCMGSRSRPWRWWRRRSGGWR